MFPKFQGQELLPYQRNSESCLIGCYNSEEAEPDDLSRQVMKPDGLSFAPEPDWTRRESSALANTFPITKNGNNVGHMQKSPVILTDKDNAR